MTICKGTSPEDGSETIIIVLEHTPRYQLAVVIKTLETRLCEVSNPWPDTGDPEAASIFHLLCDLEVPGFEST